MRRRRRKDAEIRAILARILRQSAEITQAEAARALGVSTRTIKRYEAADKPRKTA